MVLLSGFINDSQNKPAKQIVITGMIAGDTKGYNKIYCYGNGVPSDSALIVNGSFKFILSFEGPVLPLFYTEYDIKVKRAYQPFAVLIDRPGQVTVTVKNIADGLSQSNVKGLRSAELFHLFTKDERSLSGQIADMLKQHYGKSSVPLNDPDFDKINKSGDSLRHLLLCPYTVKFIQSNADSYAAVVALFNSIRFLEFSELEDSYNILSPELKGSKYGIELADHIAGIKNSMIGKLVRSFTLPDANNRPFSFDQLKGKYVYWIFGQAGVALAESHFPT